MTLEKEKKRKYDSISTAIVKQCLLEAFDIVKQFATEDQRTCSHVSNVMLSLGSIQQPSVF